ncbi:MAG: hypothetical protein ACKOZW_05200 [Cyanobium sp.]
MTQSSSSSSTAQNTCTVTNNITVPTNPSTTAQRGWNGDICVISGYNSSSSSTGQAYQQSSLTLLSFIEEGSTTSNMTNTAANTLPTGNSGKLNLLPYYQPGSTTTVNSTYNLLVSQGNNYFPVAPVGEIQGFKSFPAVTVPSASPCNSSSAANAYVFLQNMMAYPSSPLAQQFTNAMNADNSTNPATASSTNVNTFFANTTDFQNVTFEIYSAVTSYALAYAYIWGNFQTSFTYNFYTVTPTSSDSSSSTGSTNVKLNEKVTSLGSVVFKLSGSFPASVTDSNAGYTITWNPTSGSSVPLNFQNGQLVADNSSGFSSICLTCTFMDLATLTGNSADAGQTIQALTGLINGTNAIGSPVSLTQTVGEDISEGLNKILTSKVFEALQIALALYMGIEAMMKLGCWIKAKCFKGETPTESEIETTQTELKENAETKLEETGNNEPVETGENLTEAQIKTSETVDNTEAETSEAAELDIQINQEESQLSLDVNPTIEDEVDTTKDDEYDLEEIDPEDANAAGEITNLQNSITTNQQQIDAENKQLGEQDNTDVQKQEDTSEQEETDEEEEEDKEKE